MKNRLALLAICFGCAAVPAVAQTDCPWAGGEYRFQDSGIYGDFSVNADCTELVWDRLTEPETTVLELGREGWSGNLTKVAVVLLSEGNRVQVTAYGGLTRRSTVERVN